MLEFIALINLIFVVLIFYKLINQNKPSIKYSDDPLDEVSFYVWIFKSNDDEKLSINVNGLNKKIGYDILSSIEPRYSSKKLIEFPIIKKNTIEIENGNLISFTFGELNFINCEKNTSNRNAYLNTDIIGYCSTNVSKTEEFKGTVILEDKAFFKINSLLEANEYIGLRLDTILITDKIKDSSKFEFLIRSIDININQFTTTRVFYLWNSFQEKLSEVQREKIEKEYQSFYDRMVWYKNKFNIK